MYWRKVCWFLIVDSWQVKFGGYCSASLRSARCECRWWKLTSRVLWAWASLGVRAANSCWVAFLFNIVLARLSNVVWVRFAIVRNTKILYVVWRNFVTDIRVFRALLQIRCFILCNVFGCFSGFVMSGNIHFQNFFHFDNQFWKYGKKKIGFSHFAVDYQSN